jgi:hypothetical protein
VGINPVEIKLATGVLFERVEVSSTVDAGEIVVTRTGNGSGALEVLYEVRGFNATGELVSTAYGELEISAQSDSLIVDHGGLTMPSGASVASKIFVLVADGNDYLLGDVETILLP